MPTKLLLIRHGQTHWNAIKRYSGFSDVLLDKIGKLQAKKLHKRLKHVRVDKIYASDRRRAIQTAKIVFKDKEFKKICGLREIHFGIFEGLTYAQVMNKYPVVYKQWLKDPYSINIPKGESLLKFKKRIISVVKKIILKNKNKTVALVCHGGAISVILNHILKTRNFWQKIPKSASLSIVEHAGKKIKIRLFNDIKHLE